MGDEYDYDDGDHDFDDGWTYVEDEYGLVDELAESQIPDPGYSGTNAELDAESYEYDYYAFWDDLEYADDPYWDVEARPPPQNTVAPGQKRKRIAGAASGDKRRKVSAAGVARRGGGLGSKELETIVYRTHAQRYIHLHPLDTVVVGKAAGYALLPDWRTRFTDQDGLLKQKVMPKDMREAAEAVEDDTPPKKTRHADMLLDGEEDEEEWEEDEEAEEGGSALAGVDPDVLKTILQQKLAGAGLSDADETAFMASIDKMLSGEAVDDDATAELASMLLGKAGGDSAVAGFLSGQGVSLDDEDEDDEEGEEEDSAISGLDVSPAVGGRAREMAVRAGSPSAVRSAGSGKKKKVTFDVADEEGLPTPPASDETSGPDAQLSRELEAQVEGTRAGPATAVTSRKRKATTLAPEAGENESSGARAKKEPATRRTRSARAGK
ncbi:hypothetical protein LTR17_013035 [Elasticomyces elasticus]|nr:hypothetical protein LTR17_013035 [Elasticomyces elasticus]